MFAGALAVAECVGVAAASLLDDTTEGVSDGRTLDETTVEGEIDADGDPAAAVLGDDVAELGLAGRVSGILDAASVGGVWTPRPVWSVGAAEAMAMASTAQPATAAAATTVEIILPIRM